MRNPRSFHRRFGRRVLQSRILGALAVLLLAFGPAVLVAFAGAAEDDAVPDPWIGAPTAPRRTPCQFSMITITPWSVQGLATSDADWSPGVAVPGSLVPCWLCNNCESYSNAAVLGSEIWGYTWSLDGLACFSDEVSTVDSAGVSTEQVIYLPGLANGCTSTIAATLGQQFRWRVEGQGNIEVEVAGVMAAFGQDLAWQQSVISGGKAAYVGARCDCAPSSAGGTITIGKSPVVLTLPLSVFKAPSLPSDEGLVYQPLAARSAGPVPLLFVGEMLSVHGYCKVRSYADEAGILEGAEVEGWIRDSDPALTVTLRCQGQPHCIKQTTSKLAR